MLPNLAIENASDQRLIHAEFGGKASLRPTLSAQVENETNIVLGEFGAGVRFSARHSLRMQSSAISITSGYALRMKPQAMRGTAWTRFWVKPGAIRRSSGHSLWMKPRSVHIPDGLASFRHHVGVIVRYRPEKQMSVIDAGTVVALVKRVQAVWDRPVGHFPRNPMSALGLTVSAKFTIATATSARLPLQARRRHPGPDLGGTLRLRKEPLFRLLVHHRHWFNSVRDCPPMSAGIAGFSLAAWATSPSMSSML